MEGIVEAGSEEEELLYETGTGGAVEGGEGWGERWRGDGWVWREGTVERDRVEAVVGLDGAFGRKGKRVELLKEEVE
jgi:hypothetical protein